jgi:hypothetical protein
MLNDRTRVRWPEDVEETEACEGGQCRVPRDPWQVRKPARPATQSPSTLPTFTRLRLRLFPPATPPPAPATVSAASHLPLSMADRTGVRWLEDVEETEAGEGGQRRVPVTRGR